MIIGLKTKPTRFSTLCCQSVTQQSPDDERFKARIHFFEQEMIVPLDERKFETPSQTM